MRVGRMLLVVALGLGMATLAVAGGGCAIHRSGGSSCCSGSAASHWVEEALPAVERGTMAWDATTGSPGPAATAHYYALTPIECQCMAARAAPLASLMVRERGVSSGGSRHDRAAPLRSQVLTGAAAELQNDAAGTAMQLYYRLAEGEAKRNVLDRVGHELDQMLDRIAQLHRQGLQIPFDASEFERRKVEVRSQTEDLELSLTQGNHELRRLLGMESHEPGVRFWPDTKLSAEFVPMDIESEVQRGLSQRPELNVLRLLVWSLDRDTLDLTRSYLRAANGLLGEAAPGHALLVRCLMPALIDREIAARRGQLLDLRGRREREIGEQIREAIETYHARVRQVQLAVERSHAWDQRLADLNKLNTTGGTNFAEISVAKISRLQTDAQTIEAISAVEQARVHLRQLQGELAIECCGSGAGSSHETTPTAAQPTPEPDTTALSEAHSPDEAAEPKAIPLSELEPIPVERPATPEVVHSARRVFFPEQLLR